MMQWLDGLGPLKSPSLILIASPLAAYPYWNPAPPPAVACGRVAIKHWVFRAYRAADRSTFTLRPVSGLAGSVPRLAGEEAGGERQDQDEVEAADELEGAVGRQEQVIMEAGHDRVEAVAARLAGDDHLPGIDEDPVPPR